MALLEVKTSYATYTDCTLRVGQYQMDGSIAGKYMATYSTFVKVGDKVWKYCGNCFPGESVDIESEDKR